MTTLDNREQRTLTKRCTKCYETKPLEEFPPRKGRRDGRDSHCSACNTKRVRETRWKRQGIPPEEWPRLHKEADRKAEAQAARRDSVPDGFKACSRCSEVMPLEEFPPDKRVRDGRHPWCHACHTKCAREKRWAKKGIAPESWPRLHEEADRKAEARTKRPVERQRIMRELAKQHGLKYCPDCDMCLGKAFFH